MTVPPAVIVTGPAVFVVVPSVACSVYFAPAVASAAKVSEPDDVHAATIGAWAGRARA